MKNRIVWTVLVSTVIISCQKTTQPSTEGKYETAKLILNEGPFGTGTGSITAVWPDSSAQNVFAIENGMPIGNVAQHMFVQDSLLFISANVSGILHCLNRNTLKLKWSTPIAGVRNIFSDDQFTYVTNWFDSNVYQLDNLNGNILDSLDAGGNTEAIIAFDGVFWASRGGYSQVDTVVALNFDTRSVVKYEVGDMPQSFAVLHNELYVLCSGFTDWSTVSTPASLWKYNAALNNFKQVLVSTDSNLHAQDLYSNQSDLYMLSNGYSGGLLKVDFSDSLWPISAITPTIAYHWSLLNDTAYVFDAKDYSSQGMVYVYSLNGTILDSHQTGIIPRQLIH